MNNNKIKQDVTLLCVASMFFEVFDYNLLTDQETETLKTRYMLHFTGMTEEEFEKADYKVIREAELQLEKFLIDLVGELKKDCF